MDLPGKIRFPLAVLSQIFQTGRPEDLPREIPRDLAYSILIRLSRLRIAALCLAAGRCGRPQRAGAAAGAASEG